MKKWLICFVCVIGALVALCFFGKNYLPTWLSSHLSKAMGVPVIIQRLHLTTSAMQLDHLIIKNPPGCILDDALEAKKITTDTSALSLFKDPILIEHMDLFDLYLGLEFNSLSDTQGNWTTLIQNLENTIESAPKKNSSKKFLIKILAVHDLSIDLVFRKNDGKIRRLKPIPYMEFKDISSEGSFPVDELTKVVMSQILIKVFLENHLRNMLQSVIQGPQKILSPLKGLFSLQESVTPPFQQLRPTEDVEQDLRL